jgi:hypothetical protein
MKIKQFFRPNRRKVWIFLALSFLPISHTIYISLISKTSELFLIKFYSPILIFLIYPSLYVSDISYPLLGIFSSIISLFVMFLYLYLLSCVVFWLYNIVKKLYSIVKRRYERKVEYVYEDTK